MKRLTTRIVVKNFRMGAGASVQTQEGPQPIRLRDEPQNPRYESGRTYNNNNSTRTGRSEERSVRAMALKNHSRHANTYITPDSISTHLAHNSRARGKNDSTDPPDFKYEAGSKDLVSAHIPATIVEQQEPASDKVPAATGMVGGLSAMFKNQFGAGLKLQVDDEPDWGHVSEDENEDNLNLFDQRLIEVPTEDGEQATSSAGEDVLGPLKTLKMGGGSRQPKQQGALMLEGTQIGVAEDGLVRPSDAANMNNGGLRAMKLPMRERLIILCKLGSGACSAVYKALDLTDMRLVALKTIQVHDPNKRVQMIRELSALFQLLRENSRREQSHMPTAARPEKYIVSFYDAFHNQEDGVVCLMIEYMDGGSLQEIVDAGGCEDEGALANIAVQALKGLNFLHNCNQIHRDLKPGNFLISHRGEVKVADLGIMKQLPSGPGLGGAHSTGSALPRTSTFVGTATYMSPERIDGKEYSFPSDVWAFGLSILALAIGKLPIETAGGYWTILNSIRDAPPPKAPDFYSPQFQDFIDKCLRKNPDERLTIKQLLKHPFMNFATPEDLTFDQNDDRGKCELQSIAKAMQMHVETMKDDLRKRYDTEAQYLEQISPLHEKLFGNVWSDSTMQIVRRLLFNEKKVEDRRMARPRLTQLARQLHLPLEKVIHETKSYLESEEKTIDSIST